MQLRLALSALLLVAVGNAQTLVRLADGGHTILVRSSRQIEVIGISVRGPKAYTHWVASFEPAVKANVAEKFEVAMWDLVDGTPTNLPATDANLVAIAYSDSYRSAARPSTAERIARYRDDIMNGVAVLSLDACGEDCEGPVHMLLRNFAARNPGKPVPQVRTGVVPFLAPYPWWVAGSMTVVGIANGVAKVPSHDFAGNPVIIGGCTGPCSVWSTGTVSCPPWMPPPPVRPQVSTSYGAGTNCYGVGVSFGTQALYGVGGFGGSASQRWGLMSDINMVGGPGGTVYQNMRDSCGWTGPQFSSPGGGSHCN